ncbi:hypothetical protein [Pseudoalteromonas rhizosphaerae]|uniref:hypothetical protein n=1 Tax=Pseudoalteromonas rhizosphaerae TaxID=2518973 RepID=UPI00123042B5|nr:hypothetical protein [Pseudoalteromonas rhizosphaerae]
MKHSSLLICILSLALSACTSHKLNQNKYITEEHIRKVPEAELANRNTSYKAYKDAIKPGATRENFEDFVAEGILLTRANCLNTLHDIVYSNKNNRWVKDQFLIGTVLASGLMAINGASASSFEKLALGTSFLVSSSELYNNYYLLGPDAEGVISLVEKALNVQQKYALNAPSDSFTKAAQLILDYSYVCSSSKIDELVKDSLRVAKIKSPTSESYNIILLDSLREVLKVGSLTEKQLSAIYYVIEVGTTVAEGNNEVKRVLGEVLTALKGEPDKFNSAQRLFLNLPNTVKDTLNESVTYWREEKLKQEVEAFFNKKKNDISNLSLSDIKGIHGDAPQNIDDRKWAAAQTEFRNLSYELIKFIEDDKFDKVKFKHLNLSRADQGSNIVSIENN